MNMLLIIAKRNDEVKRFTFFGYHPDDLPITCAHANNQLTGQNWTILYRMYAFVDCGRPVVYDVTEDGRWGE
jgi:putative lipase involved disintegration of autophagic bodies